MDRPPRMGNQHLKPAVGVTENPGCIGVIAGCRLPQSLLSATEPIGAVHHPHLSQIRAHRSQKRWHLTGQTAITQTTGQLQHRALMAHHLLEAGIHGPRHGKNRAVAFPHRRQLGRIPNKHQSGAEGVCALQGDRQ